jgi:hypothetical protein
LGLAESCDAHRWVTAPGHSGQLFFATFALKFLTAKLAKVLAKNAKEIF